MPDLYFGIAKRSEENAKIPQSDLLPDLESFTNFYRDMYAYTEQRMDLSLASTSIDFHIYGLAGAPGGEVLSPMICAAAKIYAFLAELVSAKEVLIIDSPAATIYLSEVADKVYIANTTVIGIADQVLDMSSVNNVETLSWNRIRYNPPQVDFATAHITSIVDDNVLDGLLKSVKPGGIFVLSNASNGSEYYHSDDTFPEEIHNYIHSLNEFDSFHFQGYISYTCFIRR